MSVHPLYKMGGNAVRILGKCFSVILQNRKIICRTYLLVPCYLSIRRYHILPLLFTSREHDI
jgi:hypothetical protein